MILKIKHTEKSLTKFDLITGSFVIGYAIALFYPHIAPGGGVLLSSETIIILFLYLAFVIFMAGKFSVQEPVLVHSPLSVPLVVLTILVVITSLFSQSWPLALEAGFLYLAYVFCFIIFLSLLQEKRQRVSLVYILLLMAVGLCVWGIIQFYVFNLNPRLSSVWRLRSTFGNSNQMGGFLAMILPLYVGMFFSRKFSKRIRLSLLAVLLLMVIALLFTYARMAWIATTTAVCFVIITQLAGKGIHFRKIVSMGTPLILLCLVIFLSSTDLVNRFNTMTQEETSNTLYGRQLAWKGSMEMIKANPVTGVGPGNFSKAFRSFEPPGLTEPYVYAHSDYLQFISETGILLIPIMIWMVFQLFNHGIQKIRFSDHQERGLTLGAMGGLLAILVYSISDFNLHIPANALLFTVLAAIVASPLTEKKSVHDHHQPC